MRAFLSALMREGVVSIVVLALLCLLVWFGGMYLGMEQGHRILIILALLSIWAVVFVVQKVLAVRQSVRIENQLKAQGGSELEGADADKKAEIEALRSKFDESLQALKKTKGGKSALFTLPWYVIIGPPGSGKTTALQESGLNFPAAQGGAKVRGIGGTRNCDWWFTSDGILLDTAGRYTTVAEDQEEWFAFLEMIKNSRSGRPINGAIVAIAVDDLFRSSEAELFQMAKDVRNRLDELAARLQAEFPVYMMFTKCDLVSGFVEFFEDFNKDERSQVWGFSMPYSLPDRQYTDIFDDEVGKLESNIKARQVDLLAADRPPQKKQSIYLFPHQFKLAAAKMRDFLEALFGANAFQESAMLRGIYFTSGTQKGTPIDQILSRMGEAMGVGMGDVPGDDPAAARVEKKSYFIHDLFTRIIFRDKSLARSSRAVLRKRRALRLGIHLFSLLALSVMSWVLVSSFVGNHEIVSRVEAAGEAVNAVDDEALQIEKLRALDKLRHELMNLHNMQNEGRPIRLSFGMYHGDTMFDAGAQAYFRRLHPGWVEPCHERLENRLRELAAQVTSSSEDDEYQQLLDLWRVYRMMGGDGDVKADPLLVLTVLEDYHLWTGELGSDTEEIKKLAREQLEFYATMLEFAAPTSDPYKLLIKPDPSLVQRVSQKLTGAYWERTAYESIISRASSSLSPLTLEDVVPGGEAYMKWNPKGADTDFINQVNAFTQSAWERQIKSLIEDRAEKLARLHAELDMDDRDAAEWRNRLTRRHYETHKEVWREYLNAVLPNPGAFDSVSSTRESLAALVKENSAYRTLIRNVWERRQITLAPDLREPGPDEDDLKSLGEAFDKLTEFRTAYDRFATNTSDRRRVAQHVDNPDTLKNLSEAFGTAYIDIPSAFGTEKNETAGNALVGVIDASFEALRGEAVDEIGSRWQDEVYDVWQAEFAGRFPFAPESDERVKMAEFSKMFNPKNGAIWKVRDLIKQIADLPFSNRRLIEPTVAYGDTISAAEDLRDAMFEDGQELASIKFRLKLNQADQITSSVVQVGADQKVTDTTFGRARDFHWKQDSTNTVGAMVEAFYQPADTRRETSLGKYDELENEWGVLAIFWKHHHTFAKAKGENEYQVTWRFTVRQDESKWNLHATLTPETDHPFDSERFTKVAANMKKSEEVTK